MFYIDSNKNHSLVPKQEPTSNISDLYKSLE